ncbi:hypothetical protein DFH09DRAFT_1336172 [Mycena vulgaris]|nr:hypothetical protein DFH09DRAFT_1336172 [Mycena vulgaris]
MLYAKFSGLEDLISEDNEFSLKHCFFQHVASGKFKDDTQYCDDYKYSHGAPLSLSVDDTKLLPALHPLYDGVNQSAMHKTLERLTAAAELATKLWDLDGNWVVIQDTKHGRKTHQNNALSGAL